MKRLADREVLLGSAVRTKTYRAEQGLAQRVGGKNGSAAGECSREENGWWLPVDLSITLGGLPKGSPEDVGTYPRHRYLGICQGHLSASTRGGLESSGSKL